LNAFGLSFPFSQDGLGQFLLFLIVGVCFNLGFFKLTIHLGDHFVYITLGVFQTLFVFLCGGVLGGFIFLYQLVRHFLSLNRLLIFKVKPVVFCLNHDDDDSHGAKHFLEDGFRLDGLFFTLGGNVKFLGF